MPRPSSPPGSLDNEEGDAYSVPKPSRIKLKETKAERHQRLFDIAKRKAQHRERLISRANGYAVSPPPLRRRRATESITPPRIPPQGGGIDDPIAVDLDDEITEAGPGAGSGAGTGVGNGNGLNWAKSARRNATASASGSGSGIGQDGGYSWMGNQARSAREEQDILDERERLAYMAEQEMSEAQGDPFGAAGYDPMPMHMPHIPLRHRDPTRGYHHVSSTSSTSFTTFGGGGGLGSSTSFHFSYSTSSSSTPHHPHHAHQHSHSHLHNHPPHGPDPFTQFHPAHRPDLNQMTEREYTAYIAAQMDNRRFRQEEASRADARAARAKKEMEAERLRQVEREKAEKRKRKRDKEKREKDAAGAWAKEEIGPLPPGGGAGGVGGVVFTQTVEERKRDERERYTRRWKALGVDSAPAASTAAGVSGLGPRGAAAQATTSNGAGPAQKNEGEEIMEVDLDFNSIPWPIYSTSLVPPAAKRTANTLAQNQTLLDQLDKIHIRPFLYDLSISLAKASGHPVGPADEKLTLRQAIKIFHPDRFDSRFLTKVRESDRAMVKDGVGRCSRVINDLAAELAGR